MGYILDVRAVPDNGSVADWAAHPLTNAAVPIRLEILGRLVKEPAFLEICKEHGQS